MRYMFKDLMVTVLAEEELGPHCGSCSVISCDLPTVACGPITCGITSVIHAARSAESLTLVRQELENALEQVSAAENAARSKRQPSTRAEAEFVEQQMTDALEELRKQKDSLPPG